MTSTLTLLIVDEEALQKFFQDSYPSRLAFRQAFYNALDAHEDTLFDNSIQVMRFPDSSELEASIICQFVQGLFDGYEAIGIDQDRVCELVVYMPHVISAQDIAMVRRILGDYGFDNFNKGQFPETTSVQFIDWLSKNIGKPVYLI